MAIATYTKDRDRVARLAVSEPDEALTIARRIDEPWFRCQALAHVAYHCAGLAKKNRILGESFRAALETREPNRVVSVSAWPLKVLCKSGQNHKLTVEVERLLVIIAGEPSPVRRADALNEVLGAVLSGPRALFWRVFDTFSEACLAPLTSGKRNVKGESRLAHWVVVVDRFDPARTRQILEAIRGPTLRQEALRALRQHKNTRTGELVRLAQPGVRTRRGSVGAGAVEPRDRQMTLVAHRAFTGRRMMIDIDKLTEAELTPIRK